MPDEPFYREGGAGARENCSKRDANYIWLEACIHRRILLASASKSWPAKFVHGWEPFFEPTFNEREPDSIGPVCNVPPCGNA